MASDWRKQVKRVWIIGNGQPSFDFDGVLSENHVSELDITDEPLETGTEVSDHAFIKAKRLELMVVVSDVWNGMRKADRDNVGPLLPDKPWLVTSTGGDSSSRSQRAYQLMVGLQESMQPFDVQTGLRLYKNLLIEGLYPNQDKDTAFSLICRVTLKELKFTSTQTVTYPPRAAGAPTRGASKKVVSGDKQAVPPEAAKVSSFARKGLRALGGQ